MMKNNRPLLYIMVAALIIRLLFLLVAGIFFSQSSMDQDYEYGVIARSIVDGRGFQVPNLVTDSTGKLVQDTQTYRLTANQLPFYPVLLAVFYSLSSQHVAFMWIRLIQIIASIGTVLLIYLITKKMFNETTARIAGWIAVFYPIFIITCVRICPETLLTFFMTLLIYQILRFREQCSTKGAIITGLLLGITLLNSNVIVPAIPFIGIWLWMTQTQKTGSLKRLGIIMAVMLVVISPWLIRNYVSLGEFPMMKSSSGLNFWLGNNARATGTFYLPSGEMMDSIIPAEFHQMFASSEMAQDKWLRKDAMEYLLRDPGHFIKMIGIKTWYYIWFPPNNLVSREVLFFKKFFALPYGLVLITGILGLILGWKRNTSMMSLLLILLSTGVILYAVFIVGHLRYRMPFEPFLIIPAAWFLNDYRDRFKANKTKLLS